MNNGTIYIDKNFSVLSCNILCAHELGHLFLHGDDNNLFLTETLDPLKEFEANYFTALLLPHIINNDLEKINEFSISELNDYIKYKIIINKESNISCSFNELL